MKQVKEAAEALASAIAVTFSVTPEEHPYDDGSMHPEFAGEISRASRALSVKVLPEQRDDLAARIEQNLVKASVLNEIKSVVGDALKNALKALDTATQTNAMTRYRGEFTAPVMCVTRVSDDGRMAEVVRLDTYEVVERRELRSEERQLEMIQ